jgi:hypothetical protein
MKLLRLRSRALVVSAGLASVLSFGCQTYYLPTGQTLPTGDYLHHFPQYNPPTPAFPLPREQSNLEQATSQGGAGGQVPQAGPGQP